MESEQVLSENIKSVGENEGGKAQNGLTISPSTSFSVGRVLPVRRDDRKLLTKG